ncbi:MAG: TonB-dependent receptor [Pseudomonadota bacterium]
MNKFTLCISVFAITCSFWSTCAWSQDSDLALDPETEAFFEDAEPLGESDTEAADDAGALPVEPGTSAEPPSTDVSPVIENTAAENTAAEDSAATATPIEEVEVIGRRLRLITPLPGAEFDPEAFSVNVQTKTGEDIRDSAAINTTQFLNEQLQSITVADNAGNPFQQDVVFRGFSASPIIATPQGLSVYLDGARVNEPFGDVVNWDLIPLNAIDGLALLPGTNPLFGLNTLAGALSLTTKSGFSSPGVELSALGGSWGRNQVQLSAGHNNGFSAGYFAFTRLREDGWRERSPSEINQYFARTDLEIDDFSLTISGLHVDNFLQGNGQVPLEDFRDRPASIYTAPDNVENKLTQIWTTGRVELADSLSLTAMANLRDSGQSSVGGDFWDEWNAATRGRVDACDPNGIDGVPDGIPGNAFLADGANFGTGPGVPGCIPNGVLRLGETEQRSNGFNLQLSWVTLRNQLVIGATFDRNDTIFEQSELLGDIVGNREVVVDPDRPYPFDADDFAQFEQFFIDLNNQCILLGAAAGCGNIDALRAVVAALPGITPPLIEPTVQAIITILGGVIPAEPSNRVGDLFAATENPIVRTRLRGRSKTWSVSFYNAFQLLNSLSVNFGARYSVTKVSNSVAADRPIPLYQYTPALVDSLEERCGVEDGDANARFQCTGETFKYKAFNPALGFTWTPVDEQSVYFNVSRGSRTPSAIELACARDTGVVDPDLFQGCTIPTSFTNDPFLDQVRSTTWEVGGRGALWPQGKWNAAVFRTNLKNDILFVSLGVANRGVFDTFGRTRRQGVELGFSDELGDIQWYLNYSFVEATFESPASIVNISNSSARRVQGELNEFFIRPGDTIPGVPEHTMRANVSYQITPRFQLGLQMVSQVGSFVRGNENNLHQPGGTDSDGRINSSQRAFVGEGELDGFAIFNLDARFNLTRNAELFVQVDNLLDKRFATAGQLGLNSFTPSVFGAVDAAGFNHNSNDWTHSQFVGPGAPRAGWVGLRYRF